MGPEALNSAYNAKRGMFNESRVGITEDGTDDGKDVFDHVIVVDGNITAAVSGGLKRRALDIGGEEIEVVEQCR